MDREMELAHLRLADRHIAEGEQRIAAQAALVERIQGPSLGRAEELLRLLRETQVEWERHRGLILAVLNA